MRRAKTFSTVDWRKYLDINTNSRAKNFLKSRGDDVLWQLALNLDNAIRTNKSELVLLVHPNVGGVIRIIKSEYLEVLNLCLDWFEKKESYSKCSDIQKTIKKLSNKSTNFTTSKRKYDSLI